MDSKNTLVTLRLDFEIAKNLDIILRSIANTTKWAYVTTEREENLHFDLM